MGPRCVKLMNPTNMEYAEFYWDDIEDFILAPHVVQTLLGEKRLR